MDFALPRISSLVAGFCATSTPVLQVSKRLAAHNFMELWARSTAPKSGTRSGIDRSDYLDVPTVMAVAAYFRPTLRPGVQLPLPGHHSRLDATRASILWRDVHSPR
jgi:hypothetical protein